MVQAFLMEIFLLFLLSNDLKIEVTKFMYIQVSTDDDYHSIIIIDINHHWG